MNYIGYKVQIFPNKNQIELLTEYFGASRFVYNLGIDLEEQEYLENKGFLNKIDISTKFTELRKNFKWLQKYETSAMRLALHTVVEGYLLFFKKYNKKPKKKTKKDAYQSTAVRNDRIYIGEDEITFPGGIGTMKCGNLPSNYIIGKSNKTSKDPRPVKSYYHTRIIFDGIKYYFAFQMESTDNNPIKCVEKYGVVQNPKIQSIGIDLGFGHKYDNWIVDSTGYRMAKPDSTKDQKRLKKLSKKYNRQLRTKTDDIRSNNMKKTIAKLNKTYQKIANRKKNAIHNYVNHHIIPAQPKTVVLEDLKILDMVCKDKSMPYKDRCKFNGLLRDASFGIIREIITYTCQNAGIEIVLAPDGYKSTQICSSCGHEHKMGRNRIFKCPNCGLVIDRDENSALNLAKYAM